MYDGPDELKGEIRRVYKDNFSITVTFDVYGHLFEGHPDEVMDRLDRHWRPAGGEGADDAGGEGTSWSSQGAVEHTM